MSIYLEIVQYNYYRLLTRRGLKWMRWNEMLWMRGVTDVSSLHYHHINSKLGYQQTRVPRAAAISSFMSYYCPHPAHDEWWVTGIPHHLGNSSLLFLSSSEQGLQILLMSGVSVTSASQILESFWNIWSQVSQRKKPFSDFPARGPGMYTLSWGIHKVAVVVGWPGKLKSMMVVIE